MGKKWEKGKERVLSSSTLQENVDDAVPPSEPWTCIGQFQQDFYELARRTDLPVIPPVLLRPHRPSSATSVATSKATGVGAKEVKAPKGGKGGAAAPAASSSTAPPPAASQLSVAQPSNENDANSEDEARSQEAPPKTYVTKEFLEYFKPKIQIELENPDSPESCAEIFTRGFRVDAAMVAIFRQAWPTLEKLHTVNLWNSGLTKETLLALASFLPKCPRLKNLVLDGNEIPEQNFNVLLNEDSILEKLSLRHCGVDDDGAAKLGAALGGPLKQNAVLVSLDLAGNAITDVGAVAIAKGLRMNRALLSISLACNRLGDDGAIQLARVISQFPLTHAEIVQRRRLLMEDRANKTPTPTGKERTYSKDRPTSVESGGKDKKDKKSAKSKRTNEKQAAEDASKKGGKQGGGGGAGGRGKVTVAAAEVKSKSTPGMKGGKREKKGGDDDTHDIPEIVHPLLETIERRGEGELWVLGNRVLLSLNLARNKIGETGMKALLDAVLYQSEIADGDGKFGPGYGLLRICVGRNRLPQDHRLMTRIDDAMANRNPFQKPPTPAPVEEQG